MLTISVKHAKTGGDGLFWIGGITSDGLLKGINTTGVVLSGPVLVNNLAQPAGKATLSLKFQQMLDGGIQVINEPLTSLSLLDWQDTDGDPDQVLASSVGTLSVTGRKATSKTAALPGDLDADVIVTGGIRSIKVAHTLAGDVTAGTTIGPIHAGTITGTITQGSAITLAGDILAPRHPTRIRCFPLAP